MTSFLGSSPDESRLRRAAVASSTAPNGDRSDDGVVSSGRVRDDTPTGRARGGERRVAVDGALLVRVLDCLTEGVLLVHGDEIVYRNAAAARLLTGEGDALAGDVQLIVRRALRSGRGAEMVRASAATGGRFQLRATNLAADDLVATPLIVVTIERTSSTMPSRAVVMRQFTLTAREASVALLVAQGRSNADVAASLRISESTARHYTESVFLKLGVHTRAAAAAAILGNEQQLRRSRERRS